MGLRFDPVGGGQLQAALKQIIELERQPIKTIEARKALEEAKLKLFQEFKGKFNGIDKTLAEFSDFRKFRELKVDLGDGANLVSVTVDKEKASPGSYTVTIDQLAARTSIISNGFENPDDPVLGIGFIVVELSNGETAEVFVDEESASLRGVSNLINRQPNSPIRASVVKDGVDPERPWKLILSGKNEGSDDQVSFPEFYFLDGDEDFYIDDENDSQNALIQLEGFPIEAESNNIENFLEGMNLQLKQARPDTPFTISVSEDYQKISGKVKDLIDQMNGILSFINKQNQVDEKTDTRTTFAGDTGLTNVEYRLRNLLHEGFPVGNPDTGELSFVHLNEIGIEIDKTGMVTFKEDKFTKKLQGNFEGLSEAITGEYGFARQFREVIAGYTRTGNGLLAIKEQSMRSRIKQLDDDISNKERRLDQRSQALTEKFARLQGALGNMQRQSQYLSAALPSGGGGNLVSQLLGGG